MEIKAHNGTTPFPELDEHGLRARIIAHGVVLAVVIVSFVITVWWYVRPKLKRLSRDIQILENDFGALEKALESTRAQAEEGLPSQSALSGGASAGYGSTTSSESGDQINVFVRGRQATIVGNARDLSQVYSISQDYFDSESVDEGRKISRRPTPTERFTIKSEIFRDELPFERTFEDEAEAVRSGRPTSYFLVDERDGQGAQSPYHGVKELFEHKTLGSTGGELTLSGIRLVVPPGSLESSVKITIGVTWNQDKFPKLSEGQALLSPVVICEPKDTQFKKPVELSFPHCARDINGKWKPLLYYSSPRIDQQTDWKAMTLDDYAETNFEETRVVIKLKHFTLYALTGEAKPGETAAKDIKLLAFAPPLRVAETYTVRIYCVENYQREREKIIEGEKELYGKPVHQKLPLFVYGDENGNGKNVCLENRNMSKGWTLEGRKTEELLLRLIWHGKTPSRQFVFSSSENVDNFFGEFAGFQIDHKEESQTLNIASKAQQGPSVETEPCNLLQYKLRRRLAILLDPPDMMGNDWRMFADQLDMDHAEIRWLETQSSPTMYLLNEWEKRNESLQTLQKIMVDIKRPDAAEDIPKFYTSDA